MVDLTSSGDRDDAGLFLNSFDTGAWRACHRRADPVASHQHEDLNADRDDAGLFLNSFDTGAWRACHRRAIPVAIRRGEASVWLPRSGGRRHATLSVRSAPV
jgi:hypothetical protein